MTPITTAQTTWNSAFPAHVAASAAAVAARNAKDIACGTYEGTIRPLVKRLQASSAVDGAEHAALGITVPDRSPTPVPIPTTRPVVKVDTSQRLQHTISFADETTPTSTRKPQGVSAAELWVKVDGPPPADATQLSFLATDTRTPYLATFDGADGGKPAHYMLRWINTKGQPGPWSETATATVGA